MINPRRACAARVIVLCVSLCHWVCLILLQALVVKGTLKFRHQRSVNDTLQCFDSLILLTMLGSRDMAKIVLKARSLRSIAHAAANKTHGDVISEHAASNLAVDTRSRETHHSPIAVTFDSACDNVDLPTLLSTFTTYYR